MNAHYPNPTVNVPLELVLQAFNENNLKALKVFVAAKMATPGYFNTKGDSMDKLCSLVGLKRRTVIKHLRSLVEIGWVGYCKNQKKYYPWSWAFLFNSGAFYKRSSVSVSVESLPNFQTILATAVWSQTIDRQKYYNQRVIRERGVRNNKMAKASANTLSGFASQEEYVKKNSIPKLLPYYGLSNARLGKEICQSESRGRQIKQHAIKLSQIRTRKKFELIYEDVSYNSNMRSQLVKAYGVDAKKMRLKRGYKGNKPVINIVRQLHDEIDTLIHLKRINYQKIAGNYIRRNRSNVSAFKKFRQTEFSSGID